MNKEAMKQALKALEENVVWFSTDTMIGRSLKEKTNKAITSLRQAIREHAMYEVQRLGQEIEQEPVAWMYDWTTSEGEFLQNWTTSEAETLRDTEPTIITNVRPLYATPQPCPTCEALARTVMMDQTGRDL